ncbi:CMGC/MAPK protein kinase [Saprolegnia parasitica CBS 223.65]|uniref:Mitogen-activated protein kinase n=1 Tax=Saprolegnia parasitica (strain CBS 223.65) TaxID=695850 RepID=A0A067CSW1_SAPPC|nr:CMGC/MAPK protein kinase [Saprolegnia parasitica CBS 223.65]KDO33774.1 CMGC/MAPK protein kinase [Saprolegnia parasitica CBS 223.65]|eukprot:XP_012195411.1 CMGC/MAPK protein kinase [Saprolegnia parasitica CBS 223.65]
MTEYPSSPVSPSATDRHLQALPLRWEGYLRKRGDWLPRWDTYYVVLSGVDLTYFDKSDMEKKVEYVQSNSISLPTSCGDMDISAALPKSAKAKPLKPRGAHVIVGVETESNGKTNHRITITTSSKRTLHFTTDANLDFVIWKQMLLGALEQATLLAKRQPLGGPLPYPSPPYLVQLPVMYASFGDICRRVGKFSLLLPCLDPGIVVTSNYPPSVPMAGTYHGLGATAGFLAYISILHTLVDVSQFRVTHMAREGDLAVVTGKETIANTKNQRRYRQIWTHELRFGADGRVTHLNIVGDAIASSVAFSAHADGPMLSLPHDRDEGSSTCPPGTLRVVCAAADVPKAKKAPHIKLGLYGFPHTILKAGASSRNLQQVTYATKPAKSVAPIYWAETLDLSFAGAVPGTTAFLYVEVWAPGLMGDEMLGVAKVNLAPYLGRPSSSSDEDIALGSIPTWFDLVSPEHYASSSHSAKAKKATLGKVQLSLVFLPKAPTTSAASPASSVASLPATSSPPPILKRMSFDRLAALHEQSSTTDASSGCGLQRQSLYELPDLEAMHTFTVSGTKFRVYSRYQLIRAVGHGAYGVVIAASDQVTGNAVAIKNIPKTFDDLIDAKRIVREIRLMRHLVHPHIVRVLDVMRPPSLSRFEDTYIVTDLMETDLHRVIQSHERLDAEHIAYVTYQMLVALRYMHSASVLHRDVKPSNVLINRDCLVKLCDFGLARGLPQDDAQNAATDTGALTEYVVTRWYRAPELLLSSKYSYPIDVWSVGCILVEMFTRKALFPGHDHVHQLQLIASTLGSPSPGELGFVTNEKAKRWMTKQTVQAPKDWKRDVAPSAPDDAIDLMKRLLAFDPTQRITIEAALSHPFLAPYREAASEGLADSPFDFAFEQNSDLLDKPALQRLIFEDVCHFHPEARAELDAATAS